VLTGSRYVVRDSLGRETEVAGDDLESTQDLSGRRGYTKPAYRDELLWALRRVVEGYCTWHEKSDVECSAFLRKLYDEWKLEDSVALAAQRLWTSAKKLGGVDNGQDKGVDKGEGLEFCGMWNDVIRRDQASLARPSAMIARALNQQLVGRPSADRAGLDGAELRRFPRQPFTWRGTGWAFPT
jgi:hypothetical protein